MRVAAILATSALTLGLSAGVAAADDWKDESGKGRDGYVRYYDHDDHDGRRGHDWREHDRRNGFMPAGHLPPRGMCRVWYPHLSAGQQPAPVSCRRAIRAAERTNAVAVNSRGRILAY